VVGREDPPVRRGRGNPPPGRRRARRSGPPPRVVRPATAGIVRLLRETSAALLAGIPGSVRPRTRNPRGHRTVANASGALIDASASGDLTTLERIRWSLSRLGASVVRGWPEDRPHPPIGSAVFGRVGARGLTVHRPSWHVGVGATVRCHRAHPTTPGIQRSNRSEWSPDQIGTTLGPLTLCRLRTARRRRNPTGSGR
jgi:hypothetical protein